MAEHHDDTHKKVAHAAHSHKAHAGHARNQFHLLFNIFLASRHYSDAALNALRINSKWWGRCRDEVAPLIECLRKGSVWENVITVK